MTATTQAEAQVSMDRFWSSAGDARLRPPGRYLDPGEQIQEGDRPRWPTVGELAEKEVLMALPTAPYPATIEVHRFADDKATVAFRGNRYSVPPGMGGTELTLRHRLGTTSLEVFSPPGTEIISHHLARSGAGQVVRTEPHRAALEAAVLAQFSTARPCDRKANKPPGEAALAERARLLGALVTEPSVDLASMAEIVALAFPGAEQTKEVFGLSPEHVSRLRARAKDAGSAGLVRERGRHRKLSGRELARVRTLARSGCTQAEIATRLHVSQPTISRALSKDSGQGDLVAPPFGSEDSAPAEDSAPDGPSRIARIETGEVHSRYAGAMLLHDFLSGIDAAEILSSLPRAVARRYDAPAVMPSATFGFVLGSSSADDTLHLARADAGALVGSASFPELRTLRPRLAGIAEQSDPLALSAAPSRKRCSQQTSVPRSSTSSMTTSSPIPAPERSQGAGTPGSAQPSGDDTFVVDGTWRAICFASSEPKGLSVNLPPVIDQLIEICGKRPIMVGFDREGAYPKVFSALRERGVDWMTYRRAPLVTPTCAPSISWVEVDGKRLSFRLADEMVELGDYGEVRQLSLYEHRKVVFQILTSNSTTSSAGCCGRCGRDGASRTPSSTPRTIRASTGSAATRWTRSQTTRWWTTRRG